jgi:5-methylthioadenosine/S-adenosylhomocysteine deaminase
VYDLLIRGGHLFTMTGEGVGFVEHGAVGIKGREIAAVGPEEEISTMDRPVQTIDARDCLVMPGLIDVHMHSAATVARGLAQEVDAWMGSAYGPMVRHIADEDAPLFSALALMEGVSNGTTTFGDYEAPMMEIAAVHEAFGNRAVLCQGITEIDWSQREQWMKQGWKPGDPAFLDPSIGEVEFEKELAVYDRWNGTDEGRITNLLGPIAADMVSRELLLRAKDEARRRGTKIHLHVAQDPRENNATIQRYGLRAIPFLDSIGVLDAGTIATHLCTAEPAEVELVARRGAPMACCTNSIGTIDGIVPPARLFSSFGGVVGLGSDQAAGNNSHNIFSEMRSTAMFAKIAAGSPLPLPAWQVLRMATIGGARVLGVDDKVGTLEVGKEADLIVIDLNKPPMAPVVLHPARNIAANLVYAETGRNVRLTMVAGRVIYRDGVFTRIDERAILRDAQAAAKRFEERLGADPVIAELPITQLTDRGYI